MMALRARQQLRLVRRWASVPRLFDAEALGDERLREAVRQRMEWGNALLQAKNYERFLTHTHKTIRFAVFCRLAPLLSDTDYWRLLARIYTHCGMTAWQYPALVRRLLTAPRPGREHFMSDEDRAALAALPDPLAVYRGGQLSNAAGWSWSLDVGVAQFYALHSQINGFAVNRASGVVVHGFVSHADIVGYLCAGYQHEVVCDPARVTVESVEVLRCPGPPVEAMTDEALAAYTSGNRDGVVGVTDPILYSLACERELAGRCREREAAAI